MPIKTKLCPICKKIMEGCHYHEGLDIITASKEEIADIKKFVDNKNNLIYEVNQIIVMANDRDIAEDIADYVLENYDRR